MCNWTDYGFWPWDYERWVSDRCRKTPNGGWEKGRRAAF